MSDTEPTPGKDAPAAPRVPNSPPPATPSSTGAAGPAPSATETPAPPRKPRIGDTMPAPPSASGQQEGAQRQQSGQGQQSGSGQPGEPGTGNPRNRRRRRRGRGGGGGGGGGQHDQGQRGRAVRWQRSRAERQAVGRQRTGRPSTWFPAVVRAVGRTPVVRAGRRARAARGGATDAGRGGPGQLRAAPGARREDPPQAFGAQPQGQGARSLPDAGARHPEATHIAVLEGRSLVEHYVARPSDDVFQIHGNIYVGRVENVLPGMEAAFIDIATPKNAVLYRSDVTCDPDDVGGWRRAPHRAGAEGPPAGAVPGDQEPDRTQGSPSHPGGVDPRAFRGVRTQLHHGRDLQAAPRRRAQAAAPILDKARPRGTG